MRKYVKPEMTIEKLQANQTIASCTKSKGNFNVKFIGYGLQATGGYSVALSNANDPDLGWDVTDYKQAKDHYIDEGQGRTAATICRVYYISNGSVTAYYEDYPDGSGAYDGDLYAIASGLNWGGPVDGNNWQCVAGMNDKFIGTFTS